MSAEKSNSLKELHFRITSSYELQSRQGLKAYRGLRLVLTSYKVTVFSLGIAT